VFDMDNIEQRLEQLISTVPGLADALAKLNDAGVRYGLFAGAHIAVLTGNREPNDVDFLVHDADLPKFRQFFPAAKIKKEDHKTLLYIDKDYRGEFVSMFDIVKEGKVYPFRITEAAAERLIPLHAGDLQVNLIDPADTLLLKAVLQRGEEQGKHDITDIKALLQHTVINMDYLKLRATEMGALDEVTPLLTQLGLKLD
jgi:hypothetical protein